MYSGMHGEYPLANNAIDSTANLVLTYNNELIETYYHSTCGGMTAGLEVWGQKPKPYLLAQQDFNDSLTPWCSASRYTTWQFTWTIPQLTQIAKTFLQTARPSATFAFNHIQDIRIVQASPQGRVLVVKVYTDKGSFEMTGDRSRWLFREPDNTNKILPSNWYIIKKEGNSFIAKGRGLGHGIGMCQMGARARSRAGQSFSTILNAYYTNAQLTMIQ
jgi:stage II sporulation protein D